MKASAYAAVLMTVVMSSCETASAEIYFVGPDARYRRVSEITRLLKPGDTVNITGDITDSIEFTRHATIGNPIVIRGQTRVEGERIVRPRISIPPGAPYGIMCKGDWYVIEGLEITHALGPEFPSGSAIYYAADNLVVRNCYIHHNRQGIFGDAATSGDILVELCEFDSNGGQTSRGHTMHALFLNSIKPGAQVTVRFCYFHDGIYGTFVKSRCARNVLAYNWFENAPWQVAAIVDTNYDNLTDEQQNALHPMHSDIIGNVFLVGWAPGDRWSMLSLGAEGAGQSGTEGDFNIAHNLFITATNMAQPPVPIYVRGCVDRIKVFNNIFMEYGVKGCQVYRRNTVWDTPRTKAFIEKRGTVEPIVDGANNWVSSKAVGIPPGFVNTIRGLNPKFTDFLDCDYRPRKDSPLNGAGMWPIPRGSIMDLSPEYEPRRSIPPDLKPKVRRKATPPSIGPFESPQ